MKQPEKEKNRISTDRQETARFHSQVFMHIYIKLQPHKNAIIPFFCLKY